jgi:hypothetical protein
LPTNKTYGLSSQKDQSKKDHGAWHPAERLVHPHPAKFHRDATLVGRAINRDSRLKRNPLPSTAFRDSLPIHQDKNAFSRHGLYYNNRFFGLAWHVPLFPFFCSTARGGHDEIAYKRLGHNACSYQPSPLLMAGKP